MPDRMTLVARALNEVRSVGQARAALAAAIAEASRGFGLVDGLNPWTSPTPAQAMDALTVLRGAVDTELRMLAHRPDTSAVDEATWPRTRRAIERVYNETFKIEGVAGATASIDVGEILLDSVRNAPRVFLKAAGQAVGAVVNEAGRAAGTGIGGLFSGLGFVGVLVLVLLAASFFARRRWG